MIFGSELTAQLTWQLMIPSISNDTLKVLDREAARRQANFNLTHIELRNRFKSALEREDRLMLLWELTEKQLAEEKELSENRLNQIKLLESEIEFRNHELDAVVNACKKQRRKMFIEGLLYGTAAGAILVAIIAN